MEDILFIILGIIWAGVGIYQSSRKKQRKNRQQTASLRDQSDAQIQEGYRQSQDITGEDPEFIDQNISYSESSAQNDSYQSFAEDMKQNRQREDNQSENTDEESDKEQVKESKPAQQKTIRRTNVSKKGKKHDQWLRNIKKDFNGKKAVIYSEILNRPYSW